jgi:hypothetical protein
MATFNTTRLVNMVKLKGDLPDGRYEDSEILDLATDALVSEIAPLMVAAREEYYVRSKDFTVTAAQSDYLIPSRAVGGTLREVKLISGTQIKDLDRMDPEDIQTTASGTPNAFYIQGDNIVLYPTPSASGDTLRLTYFVRPSALVETTACAQITAINGTTVTVAVPAGWTTANTFDIVRGESGFSLKGMDLAASAVNVSDMVLASVPTDVVVGDWVCLSGESCFPWIPADAHQLLVHLTVVACLEALGDQTNLQIAAARAEALKEALKAVLTTRVQGAPRRFGTTLI